MSMIFRKKKMLSFIWVFLFVILLFACMHDGLAANLSVFAAQGDPQTSAYTSNGDTMYVMTNRGLMSWTVGSQEPDLLMSDMALGIKEISIASLLFYADELMIFDPVHNKIWAYQSGQASQVMDFSGSVLDNPTYSFSQLTYQDDCLFLRVVQKDSLAHQSRIYKMDIEQEKTELLSLQGVLELVAYQEGELLALQFDVTSSTPCYQVVFIDANSGLIKQQVSSSPQKKEGLAYSKQKNLIFAVVNGALSRLDGQAWESVGALSLPSRPFAFDVLNNYYVVASLFDGVILVDLESLQEKTPLKIQGIRTREDIDYAFSLSEFGTTILRSTESHFCAEEVYQAIQTHDNTDLFIIPLTTNVQALFDKGYLQSLGTSDQLLADHHRLDRNIAQPLQHHGEPFAVVAEMDVSGWKMKNDADSRFYPSQTIQELLVDQEKWQDHPEFDGTPWVASDYDGAPPWGQSEYLNYLLTQYLMLNDDASKPLSFTNDQFCTALTAIKESKESINDSSVIANSDAKSVMNSESDLSFYGMSYVNSHIIQSPTIAKGASAVVPAILNIYVLNPYSQNKEAAIAFLEYLSEHRSVSMQAMLNSDIANEVLFPYIQQVFEETDADISRLEIYLDSLEQEDQAATEQRLELMKLEHESRLLDPNSWNVYGPALAQYKTNIAPYLNFHQSSFLDDRRGVHSSIYEEMLNLLNQYVEGALSIDQCIQRLDSIASMHFYENSSLSE